MHSNTLRSTTAIFVSVLLLCACNKPPTAPATGAKPAAGAPGTTPAAGADTRRSDRAATRAARRAARMALRAGRHLR